jgi:hypothetical protein
VFSALSVATPALFGAVAADLCLAAPPRTGPASYGHEEAFDRLVWYKAPDLISIETV